MLTRFWAWFGFVPVREHSAVIGRLLRCQATVDFLRADRDRLHAELERLRRRQAWVQDVREAMRQEM